MKVRGRVGDLRGDRRGRRAVSSLRARPRREFPDTMSLMRSPSLAPQVPSRPTARRRTFAILVDYLTGSYQVGLIRAVERATAELDVNLLIVAGRSFGAPTARDRVQTQLYEVLGPELVDGIVLASGCLMNYCGSDDLAAYCARRAPVPVCSVAAEIPGVPSVMVGNRSGSRALVEHLIGAHGAERIAYIRGPSANREANDRFEGYQEALASHRIPFDPTLVRSGDLTMPAGVVATRDLFSRGARFDAIVAANDYMAMGALEVIRERGMRVPGDIRLGGFDDATFARFALPALTTVRQPVDRLGRVAVELLLRVHAGEAVAPVTELDAEFVTRQSCGCRLAADVRFPSMPAVGGRARMIAGLRRAREELAAELHRVIGVAPEAFGGWAQRLIDALAAQLSGDEEAFTQALTAVLEAATPYPDYVDELFKVVTVLRSRVYEQGIISCETIPELEQIWHVGQLMLGLAATNAQGRTKLDLEVVLDTVRAGFERIATSLTLPTLKQAVASTLPDIQIHHAHFALGPAGIAQPEPFLTVTRERPSLAPIEAPGSRDLVPAGFFAGGRHAHVVQPLSFEDEWYGLSVMEYGQNETVCGLLREQISSALKGGALYRTTLQQAAVRERLEREALEQETTIANRIQTRILPRHLEVEGLILAARMVPALSVGGDYYDVIPVTEGAWLGIGDVSGHGLFAGLVMLMIQSMVSALVRQRPAAGPAEHVITLNQALRDNLRQRLERDDHATLTLLRYHRSGSVTYAGAHEDLIVYRAARRRCEVLSTTGIWLGVLDDAAPLTREAELQLHDGDLLVLYTDGITEALNEQHEQFGLQRLCRAIEARAHHTPGQLADAILHEVERWQVSQLDDITLVIARQGASRLDEPEG